MAASSAVTATPVTAPTAEAVRLDEIHEGVHWRRWGPYLSERQWGTVREDYSADGNAWDYFPHDHARSRAYRWGEDGIAGFGDEQLLSVPRPRVVERPGPDPQGAAVRPDQWPRAITARTSRSCTTTSTARRPIPTCGCFTNIRRRPSRISSWSRRTGAAARTRPGVRAARHRHLRRRPLFRCRGRIREGCGRRHPDAGDGPQSRRRAGGVACAAAALGAQHLVVGAGIR